MRGYGGGYSSYGRSSYGGSYGSSRYGSGSYGSSRYGSSRYGGSGSYDGRSSSNRYSGYYTSPTSKQQQPQSNKGNYSSQTLNQKPKNSYGKSNGQQYKQPQPYQNYPQNQYNQGSSNDNSKYNNGSKQNYSNSNSRYRYKNQTVKNKTINQNINVNQQQQQHRGRFGRFGGGFGRMMRWPLMFMMFDRFRRPRHEPVPMQQTQPQHPPVINVYNPPHDQQTRDNANQETGDTGYNSQVHNETGAFNRGIDEPHDDKPLSREADLTPSSPLAPPLDANKNDSRLIKDTTTTTRVKVTRTKSEPNRLRELSHTPTIEPVSSNASSARLGGEGGGGGDNNLDIHELRGYHTNEIPNLQTRTRSSNKDLLRGLSNQTIGLQSILRQSPSQEV